MKLGNRQRDQYEKQGYLIVPQLLTPAEVESLRQRTLEIATGQLDHFPRENIEFEPDREGAPSLDAVRKLNHAHSDDVLLAHAKHPAILDVVGRLIGPDAKIYDSQLFMKPPGGVEKPYHQDSPYFPIEPMNLVTCWAALDDVTRENGCMWFILGSHRQGPLPHTQKWKVGNREDMRIPDSAIDRRREHPIMMRAGDCSFHHSLLLHRSEKNQTQNRRRGLAVHYMSAQSRWTGAADEKPSFPLVRGHEFPGCV